MMRTEQVVPYTCCKASPHTSACGFALALQLTCLPLVNAQLEEVVVTAQKRSESLLDVPIAVTAFSQEALGELGIFNADDLVQFTPGLSMRKWLQHDLFPARCRHK